MAPIITNYTSYAFKLTLPHLWPATIKTTNLKNLSVKGQSSKLAPVLQGTSFTRKSTKKSELFPVQRYISPALEGEARRGKAEGGPHTPCCRALHHSLSEQRCLAFHSANARRLPRDSLLVDCFTSEKPYKQTFTNIDDGSL